MAAKKTGKKAKVVYVAKKAKARAKRGLAGFGKGLSPKGVLVGALTLLGMKKVVGENSLLGFDLGQYNPPVQKIAAGLIDGAAGLDNADLVSAGVKEGVAIVIDNFTAGRGLFTGAQLGGIGEVGL